MRLLRRSAPMLTLATLLLGGVVSQGEAQAKYAPGKAATGFGLFSRAALRWVGNRVECSLLATGQICAGATSSGGGFWPAGTNNQYIFNSGLQVAGIIDSNSVGNPWRGEVTGAFFFSQRGGSNGQALTEIFSSADTVDLASWPAAAYVPTSPDPQADLFDPALQGQKTASDNDIWFLNWEGDPASNIGRSHPLGLAVETRGLAFRMPGRSDFIYFIHTFYNITSANAADYANAPARLRDTLVALGQRFQALNNPSLPTPLPSNGYTIRDMYFGLAADMDVTAEDAGSNYDGVNVPLSLGYTYQESFAAPSSWTFDPSIYAPPFFPGAGFVGTRFLKTPEVNGVEQGLTLFASITGGGEFSGPGNTASLYRYLTGKLDPAQGDNNCNVGNVQFTHICYINQGAAADTRHYQATGPLTLGPGEFSSIAVAYVFAAPVASGACTGPDRCSQVRPQDPTGSVTRMTSPDSIVLGLNTVDTMTGYLGYLGDLNGDGRINESEMDAVPGSLLGKAKTAQAIFDGRFVQPSAPKAPPFFLIPGNNQVTIVWQPSASEAGGDPYYATAQSQASYDPNYRQFDVAGYRIYRGVRSDPTSLELLAQFDKAGDYMQDYTGQINRLNPQNLTTCAPTLGVYLTCTAAGSINGVPLIQPVVIGLDGPVVQYQDLLPTGFGVDTIALLDTFPSGHGPTPPFDSIVPRRGPCTGQGCVGAPLDSIFTFNAAAVATRADTAITGGNSGLPALTGSGIPFLFTDSAGSCPRCGVRNLQRYYYVVTAFDLNSIRSGASSLESSRSALKNTTVQPSPSNSSSGGSLQTMVLTGRGVTLTDSVTPAINATDGRFSKPFPPANGATINLAGFLPNLLSSSGAAKLELDSLQLGSAWDDIPVVYYWTASSLGDTTSFTTRIQQDPTDIERGTSAAFSAVPLSPGPTRKYGGSKAFTLYASMTQSLVGEYYAGDYGRGCNNGASGFFPGGGCDFNGPRWFDGPSPGTNETQPDPNSGNGHVAAAGHVNQVLVGNAGFNNAGALTGVSVIYNSMAYYTTNNVYREVEGIISGAKRAADYNVYWNATTAGLIDSVIDVTHNVPVPFTDPTAGVLTSTRPLASNYGLLTAANAPAAGAYDGRAELSLTDFGCTEPLRSFATSANRIGCAVGTPSFPLTRQASLGPIVFHTDSSGQARFSGNTGTGFGMWLSGNLFLFQTATLPQGAVWSLRDYVGAISGGNGFAGNEGPYEFTPVTRPFSAVGAALELPFTAQNVVSKVSDSNLDQVHTVPDPYYVTNSLEQTSAQRVIRFVNLPTRAIIRIYSSSGVLVRILEQNSPAASELTWDLRNRGGHTVASGVYFYHLESGGARRVGRMTVVNLRR